MNTILAATNYTELAENAVAYAAAIARQNNYKLILLNDFSVSIHVMNARLSAERVEEMIDENKLLLESKALLLADEYGIQVLAKATFSFIDDAVKDIVNQYKPEVIVMGMEEKSLEQELLGNTTTSVIKKLQWPVLAVPANAKFSNPKKVIFACDVLHGVSEQLLARIKNMALITQAEVEVLLINETIDELKAIGADPNALSRIDAGLEGIDYYYKNVKSDSIIDGIAGEIKRTGADLLIMVPEQHGFWGSMVHRSKTRIMASGLNIPLFSIPV
ncbi:Nucleotide-binding universal stress protein, UspA family [Mucilaginibacter pineti]|uniref:Nucleotide-binding universal stress protein, UspA family n=1 Tax=Mucilaginibacter pineti TaxID=1391627 RepID=A0A1G6ZTW7_9SPHI|nr:universal stress protein [Mucilaginibacter pineti]SDE05657.1 Nucleotide-binding universal stress protein, UspA family [Mucilaginibacter pineti]